MDTANAIDRHIPPRAILYDPTGQAWLQFAECVRVLVANTLEDVPVVLAEVESLSQSGQYAAGFVCYEASPAFDPALQVCPALPGLPLAWFAIFGEPRILHELPAPGAPLPNMRWKPCCTKDTYLGAIHDIRNRIESGETYQVNHTIRLNAPFTGDAWNLFRHLARNQQGKHAAYIDTGRFAICSASPEAFFDLNGNHLVSRPMKGTAARGRTLAEDRAQAQWLHQSAKNRAENLMIVDMVRNDIGRVARPGTVRVPELFATECYPTLWQMTSTVEGRTDFGLAEIFSALFPCASITGAPKVQTMGIIRKLEASPRGIYTGAIGFVAPNRRASFNVAIRTVFIDRAKQLAQYGTGGGIVWDSDPDGEYDECLLKAQILTRSQPVFQLLESLLWEPDGGLFLLERHLDRLGDSLEYFGFPVDLPSVRARLADFAASLPRDEARKVRLVVSRDGEVTCEHAGLGPPLHRTVRLGLASSSVDSRNPFLFHKTTNRAVYENARAGCPETTDDTILWNENAQVTETCIGNLVIEWKHERITPPVTCGLLAGTYRAELLETGVIREGIVTLDMLRAADRIWRINSVRRWQEASLA